MGQISRIVLAWVALLVLGCSGGSKPGDRDKATLHYQLGLGSLAQEDFTSALAELMQAAKEDPESSEIQHVLGLAYHGKGRAEEAIKAYKRAIELKPDFSSAWNNLGIVYLSLKEYDKAREAFLKALDNILYPHPENAYLNLGLLAYEEQKYEESLRFYGRAKKAAPRFCGAYYYSAKTLKKTNQINAAIENIQLAIKFCPDFAEAYRYGGVLWMEKKKSATALQYFEKVYQLDPESDLGREAKRYINLLKKQKM